MESKVSRHKRLVGGVRFVEVIEKNPVSFVKTEQTVELANMRITVR